MVPSRKANAIREPLITCVGVHHLPWIDVYNGSTMIFSTRTTFGLRNIHSSSVNNDLANRFPGFEAEPDSTDGTNYYTFEQLIREILYFFDQSAVLT